MNLKMSIILGKFTNYNNILNKLYNKIRKQYKLKNNTVLNFRQFICRYCFDDNITTKQNTQPWSISVLNLSYHIFFIIIHAKRKINHKEK